MFSLCLFIGLAMAISTAFATFDAAFPSRSPPRSLCDSLPLGQGPPIFPDTPEAFQAYAPFVDAALSATTPAGYVQSYANLLTTYNEPSQFVHYVSMDTYNVGQCANACDNDDDCNAFTIFFERQPVEAPEHKRCPNPPSTTYIKCDLWSGTILPSIAINHGQMREQFHVVMAGSNAYVKDIVFNGTTPAIPSGYAIEKYDVGAAIEAPLDCNGKDTYMGLAYWPDGHFDAQRCVTACEQAHVASGRQCHFVNTYMQRRNNVPTVQHCAMFTEHWPVQYATNIGQRRGNDEIDISETDSYGVRDITADFSACLPVDDSPSVAPSLEPVIVTRTIPSLPFANAESKAMTTFETRTRLHVATLETVTETPSSSFTIPVIAPETFSDWDPVKETTTYSTRTASSSSSSSAFPMPIIAPETFSDWDPMYETATFLERQLVAPTDVPVVTDVPDFAEAFSTIATRY